MNTMNTMNTMATERRLSNVVAAGRCVQGKASCTSCTDDVAPEGPNVPWRPSGMPLKVTVNCVVSDVIHLARVTAARTGCSVTVHGQDIKTFVVKAEDDDRCFNLNVGFHEGPNDLGNTLLCKFRAWVEPDNDLGSDVRTGDGTRTDAEGNVWDGFRVRFQLVCPANTFYDVASVDRMARLCDSVAGFMKQLQDTFGKDTCWTIVSDAGVEKAKEKERHDEGQRHMARRVAFLNSYAMRVNDTRSEHVPDDLDVGDHHVSITNDRRTKEYVVTAVPRKEGAVSTLVHVKRIA